MERDQYWSDPDWCLWLEFAGRMFDRGVADKFHRDTRTSFVLLVWYGEE